MIAGILLAAGASSRFGSNKLLQSLSDGIPIVVVARNLKHAVEHVLAVVRPGDNVRSACKAKDSGSRSATPQPQEWVAVLRAVSPRQATRTEVDHLRGYAVCIS